MIVVRWWKDQEARGAVQYKDHQSITDPAHLQAVMVIDANDRNKVEGIGTGFNISDNWRIYDLEEGYLLSLDLE